VVEAAVGDYVELSPAASCRYHGFVDPSGGNGGDAFTVAISHRDGDGVVIDAVRERRPPFSPGDVITEFRSLLKSYRTSTVTGDKWAGGFPPEQFAKHGISYESAAKTKCDAYVELLPLLNSGGVVLPRNDRLVAQLVGLERRTARGTGRDNRRPLARRSRRSRQRGGRRRVACSQARLRHFAGLDRRLAHWRYEAQHALALEHYRRALDGRQHLGRQRSPQADDPI